MNKLPLAIVSCVLIFGIIFASFPSNAAFQLDINKTYTTYNTAPVSNENVGVKGFVRDIDGNLIEGAVVRLYKNFRVIGKDTTDDNGYYMIKVEEGKYDGLIAFYAGIGIAIARPVYVKDDYTHIDLALTHFQDGLRTDEPGVIDILVLDSNGKHVNDASVFLYGDHIPFFKTDSNGKILENVDEGYYTAFAWKQDVGFGIVGPFFVGRRSYFGPTKITITVQGEDTSDSAAYSTTSSASFLR